MSKDATNHVTWAALVDVALSDLPPATREFAVNELRRLAAYLDDQLYFDRCGELNLKPFAVGKPAIREEGTAWR